MWHAEAQRVPLRNSSFSCDLHFLIHYRFQIILQMHLKNEIKISAKPIIVLSWLSQPYSFKKKYYIISKQYQCNVWILLHNNIYSRRKVADFWFEMEKIVFSYYVISIHKKNHHSVMLTNTVVFPHVEGWRSIKLCLVWYSSGIWFLTPTALFYTCTYPMTPLSPTPPPLEVLIMGEIGIRWGTKPAQAST